MNKELQTVIEMMLERLANRPDAAFVISEGIAMPETVTESEAQALDAAGFKWIESEEYCGYKLDLKR